ncbi:MAG: TetR/AcrR family transcriptional regulator [Actinomycetota bacterium]
MPRQVPESRDRVLEAFLACVARVGFTKTTLDDVAREAGCARATVYRHFPGKHSVLVAAIAREADAMGAAVTAAAAAAPTLADAVLAAVDTGARRLLDHAALANVIAVEPEIVLPHISFAGGDALLAEAATRVAPAFAPFLTPPLAPRLAEWVVRIAMSYLCSPDAAELFDGVRMRALVEDFVLPGFTRPVSSNEGVVPA